MIPSADRLSGQFQGLPNRRRSARRARRSEDHDICMAGPEARRWVVPAPSTPSTPRSSRTPRGCRPSSQTILSNASTTGYARKLRQRHHQLLRRLDGRFGHHEADAALQGPGHEFDIAGRLPEGFVRRPDDTGQYGRRSSSATSAPARSRTAIRPGRYSPTCRSTLRPMTPRKPRLGRARRRERRAGPRLVAQHRRVSGLQRAGAGQFRHGLVGFDHQFAAQPIHVGQRDDRLRHGERRRTSATPRTPGTPSSPNCRSKSASRPSRIPTARRRSTPTAARPCSKAARRAP